MALVFGLRPASPSDATTLAQIENECFPDPSWTPDDFFRFNCIVAEHDGIIAGFLVSRETFPGTSDAPPEREILNLAVAARFRRLGVGLSLLTHELKRNAHLYLEVRESNADAIQLYKKAGFKEISRRTDYYANPAESAIVMSLKW